MGSKLCHAPQTPITVELFLSPLADLSKGWRRPDPELASSERTAWQPTVLMKKPAARYDTHKSAKRINHTPEFAHS